MNRGLPRIKASLIYSIQAPINAKTTVTTCRSNPKELAAKEDAKVSVVHGHHCSFLHPAMVCLLRLLPSSTFSVSSSLRKGSLHCLVCRSDGARKHGMKEIYVTSILINKTGAIGLSKCRPRIKAGA